MASDKLRYLSYFLDAYWNQMGDEVFGSIGNAASAFADSESKEYRDGLTRDVAAAGKLGLFANDFTDDVYREQYWSRFDRCMSRSDADCLCEILDNR